ncbi:DEAD/DEAH box helicase [Niabella ginsengisoli]|uniref:DNA 3'-5' helicase n=1 Tax=Niabella ginsengisoli TaxID=522298 RepID=A0ABS9SNS7_9BACT|nr:DEAD/DEAH box helicase [Niabella ginsengisoli]MCH5599936.1 DEAD/DEAH box helicase [Niabella ginsengisoli]
MAAKSAKAAPKKAKKEPEQKPKSKIDLLQELKKNFGFKQFKGKQEAIIESLLDGNDTFVIMPTGGGKSLCYQLPAVISKGVAIIVSPLIALMKNQVDLVRGYNSNDEIAHFLNSTLNKKEIKEVHDDLLAGKTKLLYVAPETLTKQENLSFSAIWRFLFCGR